MHDRFRVAAALLGGCWLLACAGEIRAQATRAPVSAPATGGAGADSARPAPALKPDPRAFRDTTLTLEEQQKADRKFLADLRRAPIDSMHLNERVVLALHAVPSAERRSVAEVSQLAAACDALTTAVPPGEWDVFVIAAGFEVINGVALSFTLPDDWTIRGFTLNPELGMPFMLGDVRAEQPRPCLIAFDCFAHPAEVAKVPKGVSHRPAEALVIARLEVTAPSSGALVLADHSNPAYGPPEVSNCWGTTRDVPQSARGRIDVGQGPGARPCRAGAPLAPPPPAPARPKSTRSAGKKPR